MQPADVICLLAEQHAPKAVIQVGLGDRQQTERLIGVLAEDAAATFTLIDPQLFIETEVAEWVKHIQRSPAGSVVEFMASRPDQVLPDLYFQELSFDLAILNPCQDEAETQVAYYYLNKLLPYEGNLLALSDTNTDAMSRLARQAQQSGQYGIRQTAGSLPHTPRLEKLLRQQVSRVPGFIRERLADFIQPEWLTSNEELGLTGDLIILERLTTQDDAIAGVDQLIESI